MGLTRTRGKAWLSRVATWPQDKASVEAVNTTNSETIEGLRQRAGRHHWLYFTGTGISALTAFSIIAAL
jgi:hypothetical protein